MEKTIRNRFDDSILLEAQRRYGIETDRIRLLDGFESFMYEFERLDGEFVLRIGHSLRRSEALIRGEVDWINYLAAGGASVARAVESQNGLLVEAIDDGRDGQFLATAFVRAPGGPPWLEGRWTDELIERYGRLIGRIHALSKDYRISNPAWQRPQWDDDVNMEVLRWLPPADAALLGHLDILMAHLRALPKDRESYGMIHQDAHPANFFADHAGNLTLFDFDDCVYGHYVYDLAMVLFYTVTNEPDPEATARAFFPTFMRGYRRENRLDPAWLQEIPHFMKLREIDLYAIIHRSWNVADIGDAWVEGFMRGRRERLHDNAPYLDLDWNEWTALG